MAELLLSEPSEAEDTVWSAPSSVSGPIYRLAFEDGAKRLFDVAASMAGLVFTLPMIVVIAIVIALEDPGPIFFAQERIGRGGKLFRCWKFRTMVVDSQARLEELLARDERASLEWLRDHKLKDDPRVTPIGRFLRKSSLDEIPQLLNILAGDMSLVGPRPIVPSEIHRYGRRFGRYCSVKPGLTGLWQISGRNNVSYSRRVAMDVLYAKERSFALDLWIILKTVPAVLLSRGSY